MIRNLLVPFLLVFTFCVEAQEASKIKSVNFIQDGEVSKLIIDFDGDFIADRKHLKKEKQILLDIKNVTADKKLLRGIDTSEFSGSAVYISPYRKPGAKNEVRFAIQLRDNIRSFIEKRKNRMILHIENRFGVFTRAKLNKVADGQVAREEDSDTQKQKILIPKSNSVEDILENLTQSGVKRYVGRKISLNVNGVSFPDILRMIGETSGFNIIIEDDVNKLKPLSINLTNLPWDQVLDTIMELGKLVAIKYGNILTITTAEKALAERQKELDEKSKNKTLEPLVTKIFPLSYASDTDIKKILEDYITKDRGSIQFDKRTQNMIVRDTVDVIEKIKKIVETLDTQTPQILIESKIVEAFENYELRAGLSGNGITFAYDAFSPSGDLESNSGTFTFNSATSTNSPVFSEASITVGRLANLAFSLELMESESKGKIISSPRVITQNGEQAQITDTTNRTFIVTTTTELGAAAATPQQIPATISLMVTPNVTNEGSIALKVDINKSGYGTTTSAGELPPTNSRQIQTNVLVENGATVSIGGIYQTDEQTIESGIPFLKDLPIIGWLFKNGYNPRETKSELLIFLTPRVINQEEAGLTNRELGEDLGV